MKYTSIETLTVKGEGGRLVLLITEVSEPLSENPEGVNEQESGQYFSKVFRTSIGNIFLHGYTTRPNE